MKWIELQLCIAHGIRTFRWFILQLMYPIDVNFHHILIIFFALLFSYKQRLPSYNFYRIAILVWSHDNNKTKSFIWTEQKTTAYIIQIVVVMLCRYGIWCIFHVILNRIFNFKVIHNKYGALVIAFHSCARNRLHFQSTLILFCTRRL